MLSFYDLLDLGVFVVDGSSDDGEPLYSLDVQKAKTHAPDIYQAYVDAIDEATLEAVEQEMLEWEMDGDFNESYK